MKFWFWVLWSIDALVAAVALYFFVVGLADGSVSSFTAGLWAIILLGIAGIIGGSILLRSAGQRVLSIILLLVLAIPAAIFGLFILLIVISKPNWH
jgi:hypothetical protein